jgi:hypothetical protein
MEKSVNSIRLIIAGTVFGSCATLVNAQSYHALALPTGAGATAMSSCGNVTGGTADGYTFRYHDGAFQVVTGDDSYFFYGASINNYGDIAGYTASPVNYSTTADILIDSAEVGVANVTFNSQATGIDDSDDAVGMVMTPLHNPTNNRPFIYTKANGRHKFLELKTNEVLAGINNSLQVVGTDLTRSRAFVYDNGTFDYITIPRTTVTQGSAINDAGTVVGSAITRAGVSQGFVYASGIGTLIGLSSGTYNYASELRALNNVGQMVGSISDPSGSQHAMLYSAGVLTDLNDVSDAPEPLSVAVGISDGGEIIAVATGASYLLVPNGQFPPNMCMTH